MGLVNTCIQGGLPFEGEPCDPGMPNQCCSTMNGSAGCACVGPQGSMGVCTNEYPLNSCVVKPSAAPSDVPSLFPSESPSMMPSTIVEKCLDMGLKFTGQECTMSMNECCDGCVCAEDDTSSTGGKCKNNVNAGTACPVISISSF